MGTTEDLINVMSDALGVERSAVELHVRRLRENGLHPKTSAGSGNKGGAQVEPPHAPLRKTRGRLGSIRAQSRLPKKLLENFLAGQFAGRLAVGHPYGNVFPNTGRKSRTFSGKVFPPFIRDDCCRIGMSAFLPISSALPPASDVAGTQAGLPLLNIPLEI